MKIIIYDVFNEFAILQKCKENNSCVHDDWGKLKPSFLGSEQQSLKKTSCYIVRDSLRFIEVARET